MEANRTRVMEQTLDVENLPVTRVLVIDDDRTVGAAIRDDASWPRMRFGAGARPQYRCQAFEASAFDVVMIDIFMPGKNGIQSLSKDIRHTSAVDSIIAMSGFRFRGFTGPAGLVFLAMAAGLGAASAYASHFPLNS